MSTLVSPGLTANHPLDSASEAPVQPIVYPRWRTTLLGILTFISAVSMVVTFGMALFYANVDATQGNVYRIFYMHVGAFSAAASALCVTVIAGVAYLITRNPRWDRLGTAGVGIGLPLATITLLTGAIWARPTWNTWWTRDPRLDAMLVMWVIYAAYMSLRSVISSPERKARFAAVYGILAFVSVIYTTIVTRERPDTLHPVVIAPQLGSSSPEAQGSFTLDQSMILTLSISSTAWIIAGLTLVWYRVRAEDLFERVRELKQRVMAGEL